jgi:hypothetical protein
MTKYPKTLLVITTEAVLERKLVADAERLGAHAWTVREVHGAWREGARDGEWEADRSIELQVVCDPTVADAIAAFVLAQYAPNYSVAMHFSSVQVLRPERF